ncbi:MAG TPA: hypothetical protein VGO08_16255, partial [Burkholderiales bacterium]|nr:hypothetical protein [Burkholderiales bacterium]
MTRIAKRSLVYAVLIGFGVLCADVSAQFSGGGGMGGGMRAPKDGGERRPDAAPTIRRNLSDEIDDRLYMLEQDLRLTPEQQPLWNRYADAVQQTVRDIERDRTRSESIEKVPMLQRLDR